MLNRLSRLLGLGFVLLGLIGFCPRVVSAQSLEPIIYTVKISSPEKHIAEVVAAVPAKGYESIELMMPIWSPGYYRVEDYAKRISDLSARTQDGRTLDLTRPEAEPVADSHRRQPEGDRVLPAFM